MTAVENPLQRILNQRQTFLQQLNFHPAKSQRSAWKIQEQMRNVPHSIRPILLPFVVSETSITAQ